MIVEKYSFLDPLNPKYLFYSSDKMVSVVLKFFLKDYAGFDSVTWHIATLPVGIFKKTTLTMLTMHADFTSSEQTRQLEVIENVISYLFDVKNETSYKKLNDVSAKIFKNKK